jgi:two-component system chemotaxis response regulator CheY
MFSDNQDFEVFSADDGAKGLMLLEELDYNADIIILDYNMPDMTGIEMLRNLKSKQPDFPVPVLMLTTEFELKTDEAKRMGIVAWILKPFKEDKLKNLVNQVFHHYPVRY